RTFVRKFPYVLRRATAARRSGKTAAPRLLRTEDGGVQGTVVKPLRWRGPAFPNSSLHPDGPNSVYIPGLGVVYFGEILVAQQSRRLTMVRIALGSDVGGDLAAADVMDNGGGSF